MTAELHLLVNRGTAWTQQKCSLNEDVPSNCHQQVHHTLYRTYSGSIFVIRVGRIHVMLCYFWLALTSCYNDNCSNKPSPNSFFVDKILLQIIIIIFIFHFLNLFEFEDFLRVKVQLSVVGQMKKFHKNNISVRWFDCQEANTNTTFSCSWCVHLVKNILPPFAA